jgi:hypothetical protein
VKPEVANVITITDLRRCGQADTFFNAWLICLLSRQKNHISRPKYSNVWYRFNLNKFLSHESRDAACIFADRSNTDSDWVKYAKVRYVIRGS